MSKTPGIVVAVNRERRVGVVRVDSERHAVVGHDDDHPLELGDVLSGDFGEPGSTLLQNLTTGEDLRAHNHVVDTSFIEASIFVS